VSLLDDDTFNVDAVSLICDNVGDDWKLKKTQEYLFVQNNKQINV
jgi:hypothetical protein